MYAFLSEFFTVVAATVWTLKHLPGLQRNEAMDGEESPPELSVAIIGAGFSGLCMGIKLKESGDTSFAIFDAAPDVGGTWRDNAYPGTQVVEPLGLVLKPGCRVQPWVQAGRGPDLRSLTRPAPPLP